MSFHNKHPFSLFYQKNSDQFYVYNDLSLGRIYYKNSYLCLLTQKQIPSTLDFLQEKLKQCPLEKNDDYRVWHFFYEYGYSLNELHSLVSDENIIAIELVYRKKRRVRHLVKRQDGFILESLRKPSVMEYEARFKKGYKELLEGNCYQFNLTDYYQYKYSLNLSPAKIISHVFARPEKLSAYAHATYLPNLEKLFISNSPECLFALRKDRSHSEDYWKLRAMPIKGTEKLLNLEDEKLIWKKLSESAKNENELFMITDLLRNDLSRIEKPKARVIHQKLPLKVPGLLHQYSLIEVGLSEYLSFDKIIQALFPGGSITGAPKKRVMKILFNLENRDRKFYCGSTVLIEEGRTSASINIRSAEVDLKSKVIEFAAGGGITLKSNSSSEFIELEAKAQSFFSLWN